MRDDTHGGPTLALRPDEASGTLCVVVEVLTGRDIRVTGWMTTVDGETQVVPKLLETLDISGFASHDVLDGPRQAWLFQRAPCGAAEMSRSLLAFGEATVEASVSMFITEVGTTAACGNYNVDARLNLAE